MRATQKNLALFLGKNNNGDEIKTTLDQYMKGYCGR